MGAARKVVPAVFAAAVLLLGLDAVGASAAVVADSGFRPDVNGFSFDNYGNEANPQNDGKPPVNLGPEQLVTLFGARVCEGGQTSPCTLIPAAAQWMADENREMNGGHCAGFAKLTQMLYKDQYDPLKGVFAPAGSLKPFDVTLSDSTYGEQIQRGIAYGFMFQALPSVLNGRVSGSPNEVLNALKASLENTSSPESYSLGFYKFNPATGAKSEGHEVTPYAVDDLGNGQADILMYDNNYPGQTRKLRVNTNNDTWSYTGSTNPAVTASDYAGNATSKTLELDPTTPGIGTQPCPFCANAGATTSRAPRYTGPPGDGGTYVSVGYSRINSPQLEVTDGSGQRIGFSDGHFADTIPGAQAIWPQSTGHQPALAPAPGGDLGAGATPNEPWLEDPAPIYWIPGSHALKITVQGSARGAPSETDLSIVDPSGTVDVNSVTLRPGERDTISITKGGQSLTYEGAAGQSDSPSFEIGVNEPDSGWVATLDAEHLRGAAKVHFDLGVDTKTLTFKTSEAGVWRAQLQRDDTEGEQREVARGIELHADQVARASYEHFEAGKRLEVVTG